MGFFDSVGSFFTDTIPSLFDGSDSPASSVLSEVGSTVADTVTKAPESSGFWDKLGDAALSPAGLNAILSSGLGLYSGLGQLDLAKKKEEADRLAEKNNMILAMAKLKAGGGGGGGGGGNSRLAANQAIIDAVRSGYKNKSGALNQWVNNYMRAYGR